VNTTLRSGTLNASDWLKRQDRQEATAVLPMRPELLKGHLDALLLAVLEPGPQHGYAVIESLRSGSDSTLDLPTGTVTRRCTGWNALD
jgi:hypothetical protein